PGSAKATGGGAPERAATARYLPAGDRAAQVHLHWAWTGNGAEPSSLPVSTSHRRTRPWPPPARKPSAATRVWPTAEKDTSLMPGTVKSFSDLEPLPRSRRYLPVSVSNRCTLPSLSPTANVCASGAKATDKVATTRDGVLLPARSSGCGLRGTARWPSSLRPATWYNATPTPCD